MYTLGFISYQDKVLLLNRAKKPHMGKWNGVGGKIEGNESPLQGIIRETIEETGITVDDYACRGCLNWVRDGVDLGHVWIFTGSVSELIHDYPQGTREGILDFKDLDWIKHNDNVGIVDNIKILWDLIWQGQPSDTYVAEYKGMLLDRTYKTN